MKLIILILFCQVTLAAEDVVYADKKRTKPIVFSSREIDFGDYKPEWNNGENPASGICRHMKGKDDVGYLKDGSEVAICKLTDGSTYRGWDLVRSWRNLKK